MSISTGRVEMPWRRATPHGGRIATGALWGLCTLTLVLLVGALSLAWYHRGSPVEHLLSNRSSPELVLFIGVASCGVVGGLVGSRRPASPIGWLFAVGAFVFALIVLASEYAVYGLITYPGSLPAAHLMAWLQAVLVVPVVVSLLAIMPLLFPTGALVSRSWRPVFWISIGWATVETLFIALRPGTLEGMPGVVNPMGVAWLGPIIDLGQELSIVVWLGIIGAVCASLVVRLRSSHAEEQQQVKWLAYAVIGWGVMVLLSYPASVIHPAGEQAAELGVAVAFAGIPAAAGVAILRYHLYDIDLIINRTLVYGILTVGVATIYVLVVGYLATALHVRDHLAVSLLSTGLVALLFQPVRDRLQQGVNRLMYGQRDDPYRVLARLGQRLETALAAEETLPTVVQTITDALRLPYAAITLDDGDGGEVVAAAGQPVASPLRLPLIYHGESAGELLLAPRVGESSLTAADRRLLEDLARQAGAAVHAVRLTADLQRSRERLITMREEERRRLRQDLHDGLGPTLASVSLQLAALRNQVSDNPDAVAILTGAKAQLQDAVTDIRSLVYALRPPTLDEMGLVGAISEHAHRLGQGGLDVSIEMPESLPPLPAAVEVAAYRIVLEALTNAVRHAYASTCRVRLTLSVGNEEATGREAERSSRAERWLCVEITDDGRGIDANARAGTGLVSMRERAAELGGAFVIEPLADRGTRVKVLLPVPASQA